MTPTHVLVRAPIRQSQLGKIEAYKLQFQPNVFPQWLELFAWISKMFWCRTPSWTPCACKMPGTSVLFSSTLVWLQHISAQMHRLDTDNTHPQKTIKMKLSWTYLRNLFRFFHRCRIGIILMRSRVSILLHASSIFRDHFPWRGVTKSGISVNIKTLGLGSLWPKFFIQVCTRVIWRISSSSASSGSNHSSDEPGCSILIIDLGRSSKYDGWWNNYPKKGGFKLNTYKMHGKNMEKTSCSLDSV